MVEDTFAKLDRRDRERVPVWIGDALSNELKAQDKRRTVRRSALAPNHHAASMPARVAAGEVWIAGTTVCPRLG
jgi:hypothetical protein